MRIVVYVTAALAVFLTGCGPESGADIAQDPPDLAVPKPESPAPTRTAPHHRLGDVPPVAGPPLIDAPLGISPPGDVQRIIEPAMLGYDLRFTGVGFESHEGKVMHAMVVRASDSFAIALTIRPVLKGLFRFQWPDLLSPGEQYRVELFASDEPFAECHMPPDHAWRAQLPVANGDLDVYFECTEQESQQACDAFDSGTLE